MKNAMEKAQNGSDSLGEKETKMGMAEARFEFDKIRNLAPQLMHQMGRADSEYSVLNDIEKRMESEEISPAEAVKEARSLFDGRQDDAAGIL